MEVDQWPFPWAVHNPKMSMNQRKNRVTILLVRVPIFHCDWLPLLSILVFQLRLAASNSGTLLGAACLVLFCDGVPSIFTNLRIRTMTAVFLREKVSPALLQKQSVQKCHKSKANQSKGSSHSNLGDVIDSNTEQPRTQLRTRSVAFLTETCSAS